MLSRWPRNFSQGPAALMWSVVHFPFTYSNRKKKGDEGEVGDTKIRNDMKPELVNTTPVIKFSRDLITFHLLKQDCHSSPNPIPSYYRHKFQNWSPYAHVSQRSSPICFYTYLPPMQLCRKDGWTISGLLLGDIISLKVFIFSVFRWKYLKSHIHLSFPSCSPWWGPSCSPGLFHATCQRVPAAADGCWRGSRQPEQHQIRVRHKGSS